PAANAVKYGANLSHFFSAKIILVHAFSLPVAGYDSIAPLTVISELQTASLEALKKTKKEIVAHLGYDPGIDCIAEPGSAIGIISELVGKRRIDAIVLGIVGNAGAMKKHLIGTTALDIARELEAPVFIVPENTSFKKIQKITFALDREEEESMSLFVSARYFCKAFNASLDILNVEDSKKTSNALFDVAAMEKILQDINHRLMRLESENPAEAIERYLSENGSDLLLLSPKKQNIFKRFFAAGVTSHL